MSSHCGAVDAEEGDNAPGSRRDQQRGGGFAGGVPWAHPRARRCVTIVGADSVVLDACSLLQQQGAVGGGAIVSETLAAAVAAMARTAAVPNAAGKEVACASPHGWARCPRGRRAGPRVPP